MTWIHLSLVEDAELHKILRMKPDSTQRNACELGNFTIAHPALAFDQTVIDFPLVLTNFSLFQTDLLCIWFS